MNRGRPFDWAQITHVAECKTMRRVIENVVIVCLLAVCVWWVDIQQLLGGALFNKSNAGETAVFAKPSTKADNHTHDGRPLFILHIGPAKTGTTTVQWYVSENEHFLLKNKIFYLGHHRNDESRKLHELINSCDGINDNECDRKWQELIKVVEYHYEQNHTVFVSEEMITGFGDAQVEQEHLWRYLKPLLSKWRVRVIWSYRRFNEWIPSKYHQAYNPRGSKYTRAKRTSWPGEEGGRSIKPFPQYASKRLEEDRFPYLPAVAKRWQKRFPNDMSVFNMHQQEGAFIQNFFCQEIPEAKAACKDLKSRKRLEVKNPSSIKTLRYDMLAVRAYKMGWVDKKMTRKEVARAVEQHAKKLGFQNMTDFPLDCLSSEQSDLLLNQSLAYEADMVPEFYMSPQGKRDLIQSFARDLESGKFCSIHVDKTLKDTRWKAFFSNLTAGP